MPLKSKDPNRGFTDASEDGEYSTTIKPSKYTEDQQSESQEVMSVVPDEDAPPPKRPRPAGDGVGSKKTAPASQSGQVTVGSSTHCL